MTTREHREEYSNVVRVLSPSSRPLSPNQQQSPVFDNNLEYLLEDLQSSISRPGSSLGQHNNNSSSYSTIGRDQSSRDMQYLAPSNTTTILRERSRSPTSDTQRVYKTETYEYSTSGGAGGGNKKPREMQQNIHQLDSLLSDLKHERETSLDRCKYCRPSCCC